MSQVLPTLPAAEAGLTVRPAVIGDLESLVAVEIACFATDRITRRSFRHFLLEAHPVFLVAERDGAVTGYVLVLLRAGTSMARLYSLAVAPRQHRRGDATALLDAAEAATRRAQRWFMRLEVNPANAAAVRLYEARGYRSIGRIADYYEDHADAVRYEKRLWRTEPGRPARAPYMPQTTEFTCGPAALMMAMAALDPDWQPTASTEFDLWREATTIYMTTGIGGSAPEGLALAAHRRGLAATLHRTGTGCSFVGNVRNAEKLNILSRVEADFEAKLTESAVPVVEAPLDAASLRALVARGGMAIVLISQYRMYGERVPHWVLVHGADDDFFYIHDPWIDPDTLDADFEKANLPVPHSEFDLMARFGRHRHRSAIALEPPRTKRNRQG